MRKNVSDFSRQVLRKLKSIVQLIMSKKLNDSIGDCVFVID